MCDNSLTIPLDENEAIPLEKFAEACRLLLGASHMEISVDQAIAIFTQEAEKYRHLEG